MKSAAGNDTTHDAAHAPGQMRNAEALNPTAVIVETPETIAVMKKVSTIGMTR